MKHLVIVESPTKAKTIGKFLGSAYKVESSFGHIRDLPRKEMGVDIEHDFTPKYVIPRANTKRVTMLKKLAKQAEDVYFATDEDREGEAISWHLKEVLGVPDAKSKRIAFHEITEEAINHALENPRDIDINLVDAQQARRVLDRLVGYELSPFLWRKVAKGLSAGRVQSVAVRLIVEREREIQKFTAQEYWSIEIEALTEKKDIFRARIFKIKDKVLDKFDINSEAQAKGIVSLLEGAKYHIDDVQKKEVSKKSPPPFITSSLQQDANRRLRFSPKQTMMIAQQLYEGIQEDAQAGGYITYMRTDSVNLSQKFLTEAQEYIKKEMGDKYAKGSKVYTTKSKLAQEAHEAIRPTSVFRTPEQVKGFLNDQQYKLYELIWKRAVASQLPDAKYDAASIEIAAEKGKEDIHYFKATGQVVSFDGFTAVYPIESEEVILPLVKKDESVAVQEILPEQHFTKPPARFSEAGLVKALESYGIGRPSTYAPTISTIVERNYAQREDRRLKPTDIAFLVNDLLVKHFPHVVDFKFTANLENDLDTIAEGKKEWVPVIRDFYEPFKKTLLEKDKELSKKDIVTETTDEICDKCGKPMAVKFGRYGKFLACTGFPDCKNAKPLETHEAGSTDAEHHNNVESIDPCEKCGSPMIMKQGRFGKFLACSNYPTCKNIRSLTDKKTGIKCPDCGEGEVIQKRSKRGKTFYGCSRYPECKYTAWERPGGPEGEGDAAPVITE